MNVAAFSLAMRLFVASICPMIPRLCCAVAALSDLAMPWFRSVLAPYSPIAFPPYADASITAVWFPMIWFCLINSQIWMPIARVVMPDSERVYRLCLAHPLCSVDLRRPDCRFSIL